jgi:two-component system chemotaxis response regulator CheY
MILVGDASEFNRRIMRDALRVAGIKRFMDAADGPSVVKIALRTPPGLLLLDSDLPHLPAVEVVRVLRKVPSMIAPAVLVTGRPSPELIEAARTLGIREILTKPLTHTALWERVGAVIRTRVQARRGTTEYGVVPESEHTV